MPALASSVLAEVEADLRQRFSCSAANASSSSSSSSSSSAPSTALSLLIPEDWASVLQPLAPDTQCDPCAGLPGLVRYAQLRCAELPMRLQMEALRTRRYEHLLRQHTRELVTLSEYVTLVSRTPPTLVAAPRGAPADAHQHPSDSSSLPSDVRVLLAPEEVEHRLERAAERICKLEAMLQQDAEAKVQCCQRMVLLSEYVRALIRRVQREASSRATAGYKRTRSEDAKSD
ncbi:hypothetical protein ABL78_1231 [Leptomonas seymouri]|uniref:Uncharacterized protein n=1 Tax=Leptomonas seymouri TaxID=5684 RepID=A0A0N1I7Q3_LEPSE|nr:hypothetical protein ABL78_1231 [Leptomonas seymouri]|eukprot:KPI89650.1 hypothetical protein ABL78_1231 [Leptomonas seymouri]